jgi:hypothetical protein
LEWVLIGFASVVAVATWKLLRSDDKPAKVPIAEVRDGEVTRVAGVVSVEKPLLAPYTGRECVYYRLEVSQNQIDRRIDAQVDEQCDFRIQDESGIAEVRVEGATFEVVGDFVELERASRLSERAQELARAHGWALQEIAQVTITEAIIPVGGTINIVGAAVRVPATEATSEERGYRDSPDTIPVFSSPLVLGEEREAVWIDSGESEA